MNNSKINILLSSNEKYLKYASVLITSILENNKGVNIYYVYSDKPSENQEKIRKYVLDKGENIQFIKPDLSLFSTIPKTSDYFSIEAYYTLFPHLFLPETLDRILYLDIDTIVTQNLEEFYNIDFEGNLLVAAGHVPHQTPKPPFDENRMCKGDYFNSGIIIYNLTQLREEITADYYTEVLKTSDRFFFDQGMLNYLFCDRTKFVNTMKYCYRFYIAKKYPEFEKEPGTRTIIHYICRSSPYKPWDLYLTDDELARLTNIPKFENGNFFYIDKFINDLNGIWWEYAHKSCFEDLLYKEMLAKKEYILRFGIPNRINSNYVKAKEFEQKYKWNELTEKNLAQKNICSDSICEVTSIEEYFKILSMEDKYILLIACRDTASTYYNDLLKRTNLNLPKVNYRDSLIAVLCKNELLYSSVGKDLLVSDFNLTSLPEKKGVIVGTNVVPTSKVCTILSQGYNEKNQTSVASIRINNIDYAINKIGLNFVVFDRSKMMVVDRFRINTHKDSKLLIDRN